MSGTDITVDPDVSDCHQYAVPMVRWEPGARERLQAAALERFGAQGFDGTTVAEIAATAGLTERTFFRHFADKREVLFSGQDEFERLFLAGIEEAGDSDPMAIVAAALEGATAFFPDGRRGDRADQELLQCARAREQDLALVGEVPEERSLGHSCRLGDLRDRGVLEPALAVEREGCLLESAAAPRLPTRHASMVVDDSY